MRPERTCGCCAVVAVLTFAGSVYAQEGVTVITQTRAATGDVTAGDMPGFPVTISESGSYRLDSNLEVPDPNTTAIDITAASVTVDLNGFSIIGPGTPGNGIGIHAPRQGSFPPAGGTTVKNGIVNGMGSTGISLFRGCRVEDVNVGGNEVGISLNIGSIVTNNVVNRNRGVGIRVLGGTVMGNTVTGNGGLGLEFGVANPTPNEVGIDVGYANNVMSGNNGGSVSNVTPQVTGGIQMGLNICGPRPCR